MRTGQADAVTLTNVPDSEGYELLVSGPKAGPASAPVSAMPPAPASPVMPLTLAEDVRLLAQRTAVREHDDQGGARVDAPAVSPSFDDAEVARAKASEAAGKAFENISTAGGAAARLQALYQASQSAFAARRPAKSP